jgi:hypothetical protein
MCGRSDIDEVDDSIGAQIFRAVALGEGAAIYKNSELILISAIKSRKGDWMRRRVNRERRAEPQEIVTKKMMMG